MALPAVAVALACLCVACRERPPDRAPRQPSPEPTDHVGDVAQEAGKGTQTLQDEPYDARAAMDPPELIHSDNFTDLANWDDHTGGDVKLQNGTILLSTSRDGIVLRKEVPADLLIEMKAKAFRWKEGASGCGFRVLLRMNKTIPARSDRPAKHDFYDLQFHVTPDVANWGGYRHILVYKRFAGEKKNRQKLFLERRWPEGKTGHWYNVRILLEGSTITAWLDGEEIFTVVDKENSLPTGRFGLGGYVWGSHAYFRDLKIRAVPREDDEE